MDKVSWNLLFPFYEGAGKTFVCLDVVNRTLLADLCDNFLYSNIRTSNGRGTDTKMYTLSEDHRWILDLKVSILFIVIWFDKP